ncbi:MAG: sulfite exporter TauE/SafE family protein [Anaerolineae bacterium]|nr:MAG: sulfite exporter TauE/SafE family protein [Anaerolineae bacterium]
MEGNQQFLFFIVVGFVAQIIDGSLGMAYGVSASSFLLTFGIPPAVASASVHAAETFTTFVSGLSHWRLGNVNWALVKRLAIPGVLGGVSGAYLLTNINGDILKPWISAYLLLMGLRILFKAFRNLPVEASLRAHPSVLGLFGGFLDAVGGGGWGPVVTTTLLADGHEPRMTIGSVNLTEFFVTFSQSITFILTIGLTLWPVITGLVLGGVVAAPLGALAARKIPARAMLILVGLTIIILSVRTIVLSLN